MQKLIGSIATALCVALTACTAIDDPNSGSSIAPIITLDSENSIYTAKVGQTITIEPSYEHLDETSTFVWLQGENIVLGTQQSLNYQSNEAGEFYITLTVTSRGGDDQKELRVDVANLTPPTISMPEINEVTKIAVGTTLQFNPAVTSALDVTYLWSINGTEISNDRQLTFKGEEIGEYNLTFSATNEDGTDEINFTIEVCDPSEIGFSWSKEQSEYNVAVGRTIRLRMVNIIGANSTEYSWVKNGELLQTSNEPTLIYKTSTEGIDTIEVQATTNGIFVTDTLFVNVCPPQGTYYRSASGASQITANKVFEYTPAPGSFINDNNAEFSTMEEANAYALERLISESYVSLGGYGGYIVVGFDHSIDVTSDYNLAIKGNAFSTSSEPGIVWVMQDENGDGEPKDTWYELAGSEYGAAETISDYSITYYRPDSPKQNTLWKDNLGGSGSIDIVVAHSQDYYYPNWIESDSYTLSGTLLKHKCEDKSENGTFWVQNPFEWGYADNFSSIDRLSDDENYNAAPQDNHFKLSRAVRFDGEKAELEYIDFVKVQTAVNFQCGWLGEVSTEVCGFSDFNLQQQ